MKVKYLPWQPHCFAFGGLEVQMLSTLQAVKNAGVNATPMDVWSRDSDFEILHLWGLDHVHDVASFFAKKSGKKIVITSLFPEVTSLNQIARHYISSMIGVRRYLKKIAARADSIVVVNDLEAHIAVKYFNIPQSKITYIPNIVNQKYFEISNSPRSSFAGLSNFVLSTGNICKRKNQLNLVKACLHADLPLVLIGHTLLGEESYGEQVDALVRQSNKIVWIKGVKENSDQLTEAYLSCGVFALPSFQEQGPISAYEALAAGCKVLLSDKKWAYQGFYQKVVRANPRSPFDISQKLVYILANAEQYSTDPAIMWPCKAESVAESYKELYQKLLGPLD